MNLRQPPNPAHQAAANGDNDASCARLSRQPHTAPHPIVTAREHRGNRVDPGVNIGHHYFATVPRAAQARAFNEIDPPRSTGMRSRMRSLRRALALGSSDKV